MDTFAGFGRAEVAGVPVLWQRDPRFKTFRLAFYLRRPLDQRAAARSLLPSLLLQGTERDPDRPSLARRMHSLFGAAVHPYASKAGESHVLCFALDAVAGRNLPDRPDQVGNGLELLGDLLSRPRLVEGAFPAETFERERAQAVNGIRTLIDDKGSYAYECAIASACAGEPMAIPEHGGLEAVEALRATDPVDALRDFTRHGQGWIVAMGDLPEWSELEAGIRTFLGGLPERIEEAVSDPEPVAERPAQRTVEHTELRQSKLVMVFRAPVLTDPAARVGRAMFVSMFGGGPNSRLFTEVREKRSLAYYASASAERYKGLLVVQVGLDGDAVPAASEEVERQLALLQSGEFEDGELETARSTMLSALSTVDDSIAQRVRFTTEQWLQKADRSPRQVAELCASGTRDDAVAAGQGIWLDHSFVLTDSEAVQ